MRDRSQNMNGVLCKRVEGFHKGEKQRFGEVQGD